MASTARKNGSTSCAASCIGICGSASTRASTWGSCTDAKVLKNQDKRASCDSARRAVTRYSRWPTQAITYRLGRDQILALRKRVQEKLGDSFSEKQFHLEFMKQGT